jgi:hypothetical protein
MAEPNSEAATLILMGDWRGSSASLSTETPELLNHRATKLPLNSSR